ncbi:floral homeotic protein PMADS 2 [Dendrobium catenatum]|uniref:floral homeotic protein PMADS 2 n=1 Tax=Dendrobium catenatum TaxID=906689 RepID=UPI00109F765E|nr:floral homeotic protein PMADS 2 [Dendrobium catenatum]
MIGKGRKKVENKLIENSSSRMVCFSKRRKGLFKKAEELSVLSGARVAVLAFSQAGKMYCSDAQTLNSLLDPQFNISSEKEAENYWELDYLEALTGNVRAFWYNKPDVQKMDYEELQKFERAILEYEQMQLAKNYGNLFEYEQMQ